MDKMTFAILVFLLLFVCLQFPRVQQDIAKASDGYPVHDLSTGLNYTNIQEAINAADYGDEILVNQGSYYENVVVNKSLSITGENSENTIVDGGTGDFTFLMTVDNVTISRFTIKAAQHFESGTTHIGVILSNITNCTLSWNFITGGDQAIALDAASQNIIAQNIVTGNHFAVVLSESKENMIRENNISNDGIAVWLTQSSDGNHIQENSITQTRGVQVTGSIGNVIAANSFTDNSPGVELDDQSSNTTLDSNIFVHDGIYVGYDSFTYGNTVKNNLVNGKPLVYLEGVSNHTVEDAGQVIVVNSNDIRLEGLNVSDTVVGAEFTTSDSVQISRSDLSNNKMDGLMLIKTKNSSITKNQLEANGVNGLNIYLSEWNNVTENTATGNEFGILCSSSTSISLSGNNLTGNRQEGIQLLNSNTNEISGNIISGNSYGGIWLLTSSNNTIVNNDIISNFKWAGYMGIGIRLIFKANYNEIYHNNIAGNNVQATVELQSEGNLWDSGYSHLGNYWSDYNGTDSNQNGIGDTPYIIDANNTDHYPLMQMFDAQQSVVPEFTSLIVPLSIMLTASIALVAHRKRARVRVRFVRERESVRQE
jgi:parallel beta-helix repeat protein